MKPKDIPMEDLKAAERKIIAGEGQLEESEANGSSEKNNLQKGYSSAHMNSVTTNGVENEKTNGIDEDEIIAIPIQEQSGRDIRFGDLSHPRQHERSDSEGSTNEDVG